MRKQNWKAKRRGNQYCAPACGRGCTYTDYLTAKKSAYQLAYQLADVPTDVKTGKWKVRVWENLGWRWSISKGAVELYCHPGSCHAFFQKSGPWGGNAVESASTPQLAIRKLLSRVRHDLQPMMEMYSRLMEVKP